MRWWRHQQGQVRELQQQQEREIRILSLAKTTNNYDFYLFDKFNQFEILYYKNEWLNLVYSLVYRLF